MIDFLMALFLFTGFVFWIFVIFMIIKILRET